MKLRVRKKAQDYAQVHRIMLLDKELSPTAKAIGSIIELYSDNFGTSFEKICEYVNLSTNTARKYVKELDSRCYSYRIQFIPTGEIIWFFDSRTLDYAYVFEEIERIGKAHQLRHLTAYQKAVPKNSDGSFLSTYNKINTEPTNLDYFQMMYDSEKQKKKNNNSRSYIQTPKEKNQGVMYE